jgi:hypothetical protein
MALLKCLIVRVNAMYMAEQRIRALYLANVKWVMDQKVATNVSINILASQIVKVKNKLFLKKSQYLISNFIRRFNLFLACNCNLEGSTGELCNSISGKCQCKAGYMGLKCDECEIGYFRLGNQCILCDCDPNGVTKEFCNRKNGKCICGEKYSGQRCEKCALEYYNYPHCLCN